MTRFFFYFRCLFTGSNTIISFFFWGIPRQARPPHFFCTKIFFRAPLFLWGPKKKFLNFFLRFYLRWNHEKKNWKKKNWNFFLDFFDQKKYFFKFKKKIKFFFVIPSQKKKTKKNFKIFFFGPPQKKGGPAKKFWCRKKMGAETLLGSPKKKIISSYLYL